MGFPDPLKTLPSISTLIGILRTSPVNSQVVLKLSISEVPSKIYGTNLERENTTYLDDSLLSFNLKDLSLSHDSISESDVDNFRISWELDVIKDDQRSLNIEDGSVVNSWSDVVIGRDGFNMFLHANIC